MRKGRDPLPPERKIDPGKPVLIYDGDCSVCRNAVEWIRGRAAPETFEYLSCHSEDLPRRFPRIEKTACLAAMHLVQQDGSVLAGEQAIPEILLRLRRLRWAAALFRLPFARSISRAFYRRFAAWRHDISRLLSPGEKP
jgi:predicted DCC family thiol-disulfide oxidoreductase YuxK